MSEESKPGGLAERLPAAVTRRFKPERLLAFGGYGDVWLAHQVALKRPVALKVLQADAVADPEEMKRFLAEAKIAASLSHPNVVIVLDHGVDDGTPWIAYEYVKGRSLRDMLDEGPVSWPVALDATRQVARAMQLAHEAGILHRDIKPENVLEAARAHYKVTDFGIAKWSGKDRAKTQTGALMGSPSYISPEQILNQPLTPACDIYGLGCMMFELLTGRLPFPSSRMAEVLNDHLNRPAPRVTSIKPDLPPPLDGLVARALEKDPKDRFKSAGDMREAIDLFIGSSDALQLGEISKDFGDGRRPAAEFPVPGAAARAFPGPGTLGTPQTPGRASANGRSISAAPTTGGWRPAQLAALILACTLLGAGLTVLVRAKLAGPTATATVPVPRLGRVALEPDGVEVTLQVGAERLTQKFPPSAGYPRELTFQVPDAAGVVQVATASLTAERAATALLEQLEGLPAAMASLPNDDWSRKLARERKKIPEAALREKVAQGLPPPLVRLWGLAAAHAGGLLAAELPVQTSARLLDRIDAFSDLTLRLRSFQLPAPVAIDSAYAPRWRPFYDAPPASARTVSCDVDPGPPVSPDARALAAELHTASQASGLQLSEHLVCASRDLAWRPVAREVAQGKLAKLVGDWSDLGLLTSPTFDLAKVKIEEVMPMRHRLTVSLPAISGDAWIGAALRPRTLATLRVSVNGLVVVRLAQREAADVSHTGGITVYHALDPRVLKQGPNELLVEGVSLNASADEPPWTGFDSMFVGFSSAGGGSAKPH